MGLRLREQQSPAAFCAKTLRAAGLLPVAGVGSVVTARCGDAPTSPPWPPPKSLAAGPRAVFRRALRAWPGSTAPRVSRLKLSRQSHPLLCCWRPGASRPTWPPRRRGRVAGAAPAVAGRLGLPAPDGQFHRSGGRRRPHVQRQTGVFRVQPVSGQARPHAGEPFSAVEGFADGDHRAQLKAGTMSAAPPRWVTADW